MAWLADWAVEHHPFFLDLQSAVVAFLNSWGPATVDELTVGIHRPLRATLLCLDKLQEKGRVTASAGRLSVSQPDTAKTGSRRTLMPTHDLDPKICNAYAAAAANHPDPALLWSQRRLTAPAAFARASYILRQLRVRSCLVWFLGDDDLVSPLVAALVPQSRVVVFDIDREVLTAVEATAVVLGTQVKTVQADLSFFTPPSEEEASVVVADPFPTRDSSFERFFWAIAYAVLNVGGVMISTCLPSHKPAGYSLAAMDTLRQMGFALVDMHREMALYEIFSFDLSRYEHKIVRSLGILPTVHHTKATFSAEKIANGVTREVTYQHGDFGQWVKYFRGHYLTHAAGAGEQERLIRVRGPITEEPAVDNSTNAERMRIELLIPDVFHAACGDGTTKSTLLSPEDVVREIGQRAGRTPDSQDISVLAAISSGSAFSAQIAGSKLALVVRALESWAR